MHADTPSAGQLSPIRQRHETKWNEEKKKWKSEREREKRREKPNKFWVETLTLKQLTTCWYFRMKNNQMFCNRKVNGTTKKKTKNNQQQPNPNESFVIVAFVVCERAHARIFPKCFSFILLITLGVFTPSYRNEIRKRKQSRCMNIWITVFSNSHSIMLRLSIFLSPSMRCVCVFVCVSMLFGKCNI